jgi:hypothetical protein
LIFFLNWAGWKFCFIVFFKKNIMDCYNVSPQGFYFATVLPHMFFFLNYLCQFFLILSWLRI